MFSANVDVGMKSSFISYIYTLYILAKLKVFLRLSQCMWLMEYMIMKAPLLLTTRILLFLSRVTRLTVENYGSAWYL